MEFNNNSGMYRNMMEQKDVLAGLIDGYPNNVANFAEQLLAAEQLYFIGTGASLNAALASVPAFAKLAGKMPIVLPASEINYYTHLFNEKTAVVLISQSGDSYETKEMCALMQKKGLKFWGITNEAGSTLAKQATQVLFMNTGNEVSSATKTQTATLLLLYMVALYGRNNAEALLKQVLKQVEFAITSGCKAAKAAAIQLKNTRLAYVLGDNINGATARQGALMLKEKDFICAEGMTASEYRHGAVEVSEKGLEIIIVAPTKVNLVEMEKHVSFLLSIGCNITLIAAKTMAGVAIERFIPILEAEEDVLSSLAATIPLQALAENIAQLNGYDVDGFRYLSKVVAKYE